MFYTSPINKVFNNTIQSMLQYNFFDMGSTTLTPPKDTQNVHASGKILTQFYKSARSVLFLDISMFTVNQQPFEGDHYNWVLQEKLNF